MINPGSELWDQAFYWLSPEDGREGSAREWVVAQYREGDGFYLTGSAYPLLEGDAERRFVIMGPIIKPLSTIRMTIQFSNKDPRDDRPE